MDKQTKDTETKENKGAQKPEYVDFAQLRALFSIPRSTAYELEAVGELKFARLRKLGKHRGKVLVNCDSVRAYLESCFANERGPASGAASNK